MDLHVVILAGGMGTRLWPVSRRTHPKQLLLLGNQTLLATTYDRIAPVSRKTWLVVGREHLELCLAEVPQAATLAEPVARNTAVAAALAAMHIVKQDPEGVMLVLPADHFVRDPHAFRAAINKCLPYAHRIALLGITPTHPETAYGYIKRGRALGGGVYAVEEFCEKPSQQKAQAFILQGTYDWNAGIFILPASTYLQKIADHLPNLYEAITPLQKTIGTSQYDDALKDIYAQLPSVSIDYGIMEHVHDAVVVPVQCGWSDVGNWDALSSVLQHDADGNVAFGRVASLNNKGCIFYASEGYVVAASHLQDMIVVHTKDATLVAPKDDAQAVRDIHQLLNDRKWTEYL
jgi:mannose-1-phosphate guanylyltransferase/mannose-6-phosphate isomerase